jgi:hypothetical protein
LFPAAMIDAVVARPGIEERMLQWRINQPARTWELVDRTVDRFSEVVNPPFRAEKILIVDPFYYRLNAKKDESLQIVDSREGQYDLLDVIAENAGMAGLNYELLSPYDLDENDIDEYNDLVQARRWFFHSYDHATEPQLNVLEESHIQRLIDHYGTEHVLFMGVFSMEDRNIVKGVTALYVFLVPPLWPYTMPKWINADHSTWIVGSIYNLRTGENEFNYGFNVKNRTKSFVLDSHIYNMFYKIAN